MAKIVLIGLEQDAAKQICRTLSADRHQIQHQTQDVGLRDLRDADIVFAGGEPNYYISLLALIRKSRPSLPFVVITGTPETREWLNALEAGATDYCSTPIDTRQLRWLMEFAVPDTHLA